MRYIILVAALTCAATAAPEANVTLSADYASAYTFRGVKLANGSFQPAINATYGAKETDRGTGDGAGGINAALVPSIYGTVWANRPLSSRLNSEIDFTVGATVPCGLDVGMTAYTYPGSARTTWESYLGYAREFAKTKASVYVYRDLTLLTAAIELKVSQGLLSFGKASISVDAAVGNSSGDEQSYAYWSVGPSARYEVTPSMSVTAGLQYVSSDEKLIERDIWAGRLSVSYAF
jgi:hypothetical protein